MLVKQLCVCACIMGYLYLMLEKDIAITAPWSLDLYDENTVEKSPLRTCAYCLCLFNSVTCYAAKGF